jgi:hypothetical protein
MRTCPFHGCDDKLPDNLFACKSHWFRLSRTDQQTIHAAYADYLDDQLTVEELRDLQQQILGERGDARKGDS